MKPLVVAALLAAVGAEAPVSLRVYPRFLYAGQAARLACRVPRDASNRRLEMGIDGYRTSKVQLDGEDARVTHEWTIDHVPCNVGPAFCRLTRVESRDAYVSQPLGVLGCDDPTNPEAR